MAHTHCTLHLVLSQHAISAPQGRYGFAGVAAVGGAGGMYPLLFGVLKSGEGDEEDAEEESGEKEDEDEVERDGV